MDTFYIGSYGIVPLAVDKHRENVEFYLKRIRRLNRSDYSLRAQKLDDATAYINFEQEQMHGYSKGIILPYRDCRLLDSELDGYFKSLNLCSEVLYQVYSFLGDTPYKADIGIIKSCLQLLWRIQTKNKRRKCFEDAIIKNASVFTMDINRYLTFIKNDKEQLRMEALWRMQIEDGELFDKR